MGVSSQAGDIPAALLEDMDLAGLPAVVGPVTDVNVSLGVYGHVDRVIDLSRACPLAAEMRDIVAGGCELLHSVVFEVTNVDTTFVVDGDAPRGVELAGFAAIAAPTGQ